MTTLRKNKFLEETFFISFSDIQRKYLSFVKNFSAGLSKLHSTCPAEHFEEKFVRKKYNYYFRTLSRKIFGLLAKVFRQGEENSRSKGTLRPFLKKSNFFIILGIWAKKNFRQGCQYCILRIRDIWRKVFCWRRLFFYSFSEIERKNLGLLAQFFWQGCHNCIIRVHRDVMRKKQISRELFFISFSDIQRKYLSFVKNFSAGLSKLHSTCPAEHFEEKLVRKK